MDIVVVVVTPVVAVVVILVVAVMIHAIYAAVLVKNEKSAESIIKNIESICVNAFANNNTIVDAVATTVAVDTVAAVDTVIMADTVDMVMDITQ
ncbi:hypothetical protein CLTEP_26060 [Clostridium tepidiprofundi DSM 19306]|uniref:Uncharacterized protein n=1 Tax=Clostridium tepidiprofundi DSM 19306 TaxID=1121338 RepID=A0A151AS91_9CLOT|nr:hypothetical protein CLTEP_26060 [Clostridium tepidiprofundi DSM 19306]